MNSPRIQPFKPKLTPVKIAIVGEAPGETEIELGEPFVGSSGQELTRMLSEAGIIRQDCYITNVIMERPPQNDIKNFCLSAKDVAAEYMCYVGRLRELHPDVDFPAKYPLQYLERGFYLSPKFIPELIRLEREIRAIQPNVVIALGNTACWALLGTSGISKLRGTACHSTLIPGLKVLPTFHPSAVLRAWNLRPVTVADLMKANRESEYAEIKRPEREVWIEPTLDDLLEFERKYMHEVKLKSIDVETAKGQITCIGFSPDKEHALCVPFWDYRKPDWNYWGSQREEVQAWEFVSRHVDDNTEKLFQNGLYDIQYIWRAHGLRLRNCSHDTMLMHHALYPELEKGLGFLGSIYSNEASWKTMRPRGRKEEEKKDA